LIKVREQNIVRWKRELKENSIYYFSVPGGKPNEHQLEDVEGWGKELGVRCLV
jgi:hypothetical protein